MLNLFCSNPDCRWHTESRGGRFVLRDGKWFCQDCFYQRPVMNDGKNLWDFETTHFNGQRTHVKSLADLRRLERQYGVRSVAANMEERRWAEPPRGR